MQYYCGNVIKLSLWNPNTRRPIQQLSVFAEPDIARFNARLPFEDIESE